MWTRKIPNAEKYATHVENQLRAEHGLPLRDHYGYDITTGILRPIEPRLLTPFNLPINYR